MILARAEEKAEKQKYWIHNVFWAREEEEIMFCLNAWKIKAKTFQV